MAYKKLKINGKTIDEHRFVMERHLKRKLSRYEVVHHINGNGMDNRIENLEVMSLSEHSSRHMKEMCRNNGGVPPNLGKGKGFRFYPGHRKTPAQKLNEELVREIKTRIPLCKNLSQLAREYGVTRYMIYLIRDGKTWKWVQPTS